MYTASIVVEAATVIHAATFKRPQKYDSNREIGFGDKMEVKWYWPPAVG